MNVHEAASGSSCCTFLTAKAKAVPAWVPIVIFLILSGVTLLIANEYLPGSHDWSWLKDGSLFDSNSDNFAKLQLLIPIMGVDLLLLAASVWLYCHNKPQQESGIERNGLIYPPNNISAPANPPPSTKPNHRMINVMIRIDKKWVPLLVVITDTTSFAQLCTKLYEIRGAPAKTNYAWEIRAALDSQSHPVCTYTPIQAANHLVWTMIDPYLPMSLWLIEPK